MTDEEGHAASGCDQAGGDGQDRFEAFDGAESDHVERRARKGFGAAGLYIDVRQCKRTRDFFEERCFLLV
jgi:hypothetical protein